MKAVDLCRDDFLALCCRRSLKSSMIRERHDISWDKRVAFFFFVNSFGKVCLFRTGGEGHPTWILFNSCLGSSSDYGKICGVRENCKMQNTTPNPGIEAPPNLLQ